MSETQSSLLLKKQLAGKCKFSGKYANGQIHRIPKSWIASFFVFFFWYNVRDREWVRRAPSNSHVRQRVRLQCGILFDDRVSYIDIDLYIHTFIWYVREKKMPLKSVAVRFFFSINCSRWIFLVSILCVGHFSANCQVNARFNVRLKSKINGEFNFTISNKNVHDSLCLLQDSIDSWRIGLSCFFYSELNFS